VSEEQSEDNEVEALTAEEELELLQQQISATTKRIKE
jgi:hypothetical protein